MTELVDFNDLQTSEASDPVTDQIEAGIAAAMNGPAPSPLSEVPPASYLPDGGPDCQPSAPNLDEAPPLMDLSDAADYCLSPATLC